MREEDLDKVLEIEGTSFSRPWTKQHFLDEIDAPYGYPSVALLAGGTVAGFLCLKLVLDEAEILDVAVDPCQRGKGIGRRLVEGALAFGRERGAEVVSLEVRVGNSEAISLYQRMGFQETGRRKRYYENGDDAILMEYTFSQSP